MYEQAPPFCVQIELVEGCNLRCNFCGLNGIRGKDNDFKYMTMKTAMGIANDIRDAEWNARLEFAMHGEPTVNPHVIQIIRMFRRKLPKNPMMMTSNGGGLLTNPTERIDALLENLNVLALDWYENVKIVPSIMKRYKGIHEFKRYPQDKDANPHRRRKTNEHDLVVVQDIAEATAGNHATLNNHCGCGSPLNDKADGVRCAKPFRELSVRWDGNIAVCCNDWRGIYKIGNTNEETISDIWQSDGFYAARKKLYHGMRDFGPCEGCDALSYRPGLLPDQKGKETLPKPSADDLRTIEECCAGKPYTKPVLRTWEIG